MHVSISTVLYRTTHSNINYLKNTVLKFRSSVFHCIANILKSVLYGKLDVRSPMRILSYNGNPSNLKVAFIVTRSWKTSQTQTVCYSF